MFFPETLDKPHTLKKKIKFNLNYVIVPSEAVDEVWIT